MSIKIAYKKQLKNIFLDVDFEMPDSGITVLFGPSGAGKSTLLNLIAGLGDKENSEQLSRFQLKQVEYDNSDKKIKVNPWQRNIGYVFQEHRLFPHLSVNENILFGFKRSDSPLDPGRLIEQFKIDELLNHYPEQLSGGQKQRVAMVRALLANPELLILDEPLAALDYQSRQELLPFIECIHKELSIPVIYVSHDIKEVLRLADYVVVMGQGKVIDQGEIEDLCISQPLLTQQEGASFILQGKVSKIIEEDKLVQVSCGETEIYIADQNMQLQQALRILIHAKDVSLCLSPPDDSSILNCVAVRVEDVHTDVNGKLRVIARIKAGNDEQIIVSMISHRSARLLQVEKGRELYAQFKATAMIK